MYQIKTGNSILYDSTNKDQYPVKDAKLNLVIREAGSLDFTVMNGHPNYDKAKKIHSFVTVLRDGVELFYGRILRYDTDIFDNLKVYCEGALTFLLDSDMEKADYTETLEAFFRRCISNHNSQVESAKRFTVRNVTVRNANVSHKFSLTSSYQKTKEVIENQLVSPYGGYLSVAPNPSGGHYIDWLSGYGVLNPQTIKIGANIIDKNGTRSGENLFTIMRPLGKASSGRGDDVTISSLSQSDVSISDCTKSGATLRLTDLISEHGSIISTVNFQDADTPIKLLREAEQYITKMRSKLPAVVDISYVDFHYLNPDVDYVYIGDRFNNLEGFSGEVMVVASLNLDLENPANDSINFKNEQELDDLNGRANGGGSSGGSSRSSSLSGVAGTHLKYITEEEELLKEHTKTIEITAEETLQLSGKMTYLTGRNVFVLSKDAPGEPGKILLGVGHPVDNGDEETSLDITFDNVRISNSVGPQTLQIDEVQEIVGSEIWTKRNSIVAATGVLEVDEDNNLHVKNGSGLFLDDRTGSLAVYNEGNLTAGVIVDKINSGQVSIVGSKIDLGGAAIISRINNSSTGKIEAARIELPADTIIDVVNGQGTLTINAERLNLGGAVIIDRINEADTSVKINASQIDITGGGIINVINADNQLGSLKIKASAVDLGDYATVTALEAQEAEFDDLISGNTIADVLSADFMEAQDFRIPASGSFMFQRVGIRFRDVLSPDGLRVVHVLGANESYYPDQSIASPFWSPAIASFGTATSSGGQITIPTTRLDGTAGPSINFNMADTAWYTDQISAFKMAVSTALSSAKWNASSSTSIYASLDTVNKRLQVNQATVKVQYPGESTPTSISIGLGNLDLSDELDALIDSNYTRGWNAAATLADFSSRAAGSSTSYSANNFPKTGGGTKTLQITTTRETINGTNYAVTKIDGVKFTQYPIEAQPDVGSVTLSSSGWYGPGGQNTITARNAQGTAVDSITIDLPSFSSSGGATFTNHKTTVYFTTASVTSGALANVTVDATSEYNSGRNSGWNQAVEKIVLPSQGTATSFGLTIPDTNFDTSRDLTFSLTKGATPGTSGFAAVSLSGTVVGRITIGDWYTAGWDACHDKITPPAKGTSASMSFKVPTATAGSTSQKTYTYTLSGSSSYVNLKDQSDNVVARIATPTSGFSLTSAWSNTGTPVTTNNLTVTLKGTTISNTTKLFMTQGDKWSNHKTDVYTRIASTKGDIKLKMTVDATTVYNAGVTAGKTTGWANAQGKVAWPTTTKTTKTSMTVKVPSATVGNVASMNFTLSTTTWTSGKCTVKIIKQGDDDIYAMKTLSVTDALTSHTNCVAGLTRFAGPTGSYSVNLYYLYQGNYLSAGTHYWYYKSANSTPTTYYSIK